MNIFKKLINNKKISSIVIFSFIAIIIMQSIFFFFSLIFFNINKNLEKDVYNRILTKTIENAKELEDTMRKTWSNPDYMKSIINLANDRYNDSLKDDKIKKIDEKMANALLNMIQNMRVSGGFVVFYNDKNSRFNDILYLEDVNTSSVSLDRNDIILRAGDSEIARNMGLSLSNNWELLYNERFPLRFDLYKKMKEKQRIFDKHNMINMGSWYANDRIFNGEKKIYIL